VIPYWQKFPDAPVSAWRDNVIVSAPNSRPVIVPAARARPHVPTVMPTLSPLNDRVDGPVARPPAWNAGWVAAIQHLGVVTV